MNLEKGVEGHVLVCSHASAKRSINTPNSKKLHFLLHTPGSLDASFPMALAAGQKQAIEETINVLVNTSPPRGKRHLSAMFMDLVDRAEYPEYYEVR